MQIHEPEPFIAYTIRKTDKGRFAVAGWHNRAVALWSCEPATQHLWSGKAQFGQVVAETNEIAGARAVLPRNVSRIEGLLSNVEVWVAS